MNGFGPVASEPNGSVPDDHSDTPVPHQTQTEGNVGRSTLARVRMRGYQTPPGAGGVGNSVLGGSRKPPAPPSEPATSSAPPPADGAPTEIVVATEDIDITGAVAAVKLDGRYTDLLVGSQSGLAAQRRGRAEAALRASMDRAETPLPLRANQEEVGKATAEGLSSLHFPDDLPDEWRQRLPELVAEVASLNRNLEAMRSAIPAWIAAAKAQGVNDVPDQQAIEAATSLAIEATAVAGKELASPTPDFHRLSFAWRALKVAWGVIKPFVYLAAAGAMWLTTKAIEPVASRFGEKLGKEFEGEMDNVVDGLRQFLDNFGWPL